MAENEIRVDHERLQAFVTEIFEKAGLKPADATFHAKALVDTNLWGVDSHGVLRVPAYVRRMRSGAVNPRPNIQITRGSLGLEVLDGDDGMGYVVGRAAMARAIEMRCRCPPENSWG